MIDDGIFVNSRELAKAVGRDPAQVASNLRIAMLAPDIVHQIITGNAPKTLTSQTMRHEIPELWTDQIETFFGKRGATRQHGRLRYRHSPSRKPLPIQR
jgi:hypothetical protein